MSEETIESVEASEPESVESGESEEVIETAVKPVEPPRKFKVKVDDAEEEVEEDELLKGYQKAKASDKRFQEASALRKVAEQEKAQIQELLSQIRENPDLLEQLGIDLDGYSEKRMLKKLEKALKSPEELELEELRSFKAKQEEQGKKAAEVQAAQAKEQEYAQVTEQIDNEIFETLQSAGMKPTPRLIARMAEQLLASLEEDGSRVSAKDAFSRVKNDYQADVSELLESLEPSQLAEMFPSLVKKLRDHSIAQAQSAQVPSFKAGATPKQVMEAKPRKRSIDDILG